MRIYGEFQLSGHRFISLGPDNDTDPLQWEIVVIASNGDEVRRVIVPMIHPPTFGVDVEDFDARDDAVEKIIRELGLQ